MTWMADCCRAAVALRGLASCAAAAMAASCPPPPMAAADRSTTAFTKVLKQRSRFQFNLSLHSMERRFTFLQRLVAPACYVDTAAENAVATVFKNKRQ